METTYTVTETHINNFRGTTDKIVVLDLDRPAAQSLVTERLNKLTPKGYEVHRFGHDLVGLPTSYVLDWGKAKASEMTPGYRVELAIVAVAVEPKLAVVNIIDGRYTVVFEDGTYRTIKVETYTDGNFAGKRIASFLSGPDNGRDYQGFAFVNDGGFNIWKRYVGSGLDNSLEVLFQDPEKSGVEYALRSSRCRRCGRDLTVPASLHAGYGPECAKKV